MGQNELTKSHFSVPGAAPSAGHQHEVQLRPADRGALQDGPLLPRGLVRVGAGEGDGDPNDGDSVDDDDHVAGHGPDAEHKVSVTPGQPQQDCHRPGNDLPYHSSILLTLSCHWSGQLDEHGAGVQEATHQVSPD